MAYLSSDKITGTVNINIYASDDGRIINSTKSGSIYTKGSSGTNSGLCSNCRKFRKYSIASTRFEIQSNHNGLNDFTMCAWVYPVKYGNTDFAIVSMSTKEYAFIEGNNGNYNCGINTAIQGQGSYLVGKATFNSWRHYAITKKGNIVYFFKNGKMIHSETIADNRYLDSSHFLFQNINKSGDNIYGFDTGNNFYLDDFVFISNQCLWTSDYTVPEEPLIGDIGNASALWNKLNIFEAKNIPHDDDTDTTNSNVLLNCY